MFEPSTAHSDPLGNAETAWIGGSRWSWVPSMLVWCTPRCTPGEVEMEAAGIGPAQDFNRLAFAIPVGPVRRAKGGKRSSISAECR